MKISRRQCLGGLVAGVGAAQLGCVLGGGPAVGADEEAGKAAQPIRIVRFSAKGPPAYGIVAGDRVRELDGSPFSSLIETGRTYPLGEVKLLYPCEPPKVLALAGNYKSHLAGQPLFKNPEVFIKSPSALQDPDGAIVIPKGTSDVHYEGELVIVMGKKAKNVSPAEASACIFGFTCGNDVSARDWQKNDRQWWRAKACDTFAPLGPWIVHGIDARDLLLTTRLNGKEVQKARTSELIFGSSEVVSFISEHMTLLPGDVIYTGTPGTTSAMKPGDAVEVEIEGIGVLKNKVA